MIGKLGIAAVESIGVDIERPVVQRRGVVEGKTVGKLPQVVYTALERMIHIPHLVIRQKWLVGEETARHSVDNSVSIMRVQRNGSYPYKCARALPHRTIVHRRIATAAATASCLFSLPSFVFCQPLFQIRWRLELWLLRLPSCGVRGTARSGIPCGCSTFGLCLVESCDDALVVCLSDLCRDAFHAKYFDFESLAIGQRVVDAC
jgi:hypothetical protein